MASFLSAAVIAHFYLESTAELVGMLSINGALLIVDVSA